MAQGKRTNVERVVLALREPTGQVTPGHRYANWPRSRARRAFADVGFDLAGSTCEVEAGELRQACEEHLDKCSTRDVIALYEFSERAIEHAGPRAVLSAEPRLAA